MKTINDTDIDVEEHSVSEQLERTSINMITFSALDPNSGIPLNIPNILGGEDIITDEVSKLKVEEALGQLNIQSLFDSSSISLESCMYETFHIKNDDDKKITPNIYLLKSHTNSVYLINFLATPYADLNLDAYFEEVEFMSRSFSGVFRRTSAQIENGDIDEDMQEKICRDTVDNLSGYMHYTIFQERGLRQPLTQTEKKVPFMAIGLLLYLKFDHNEYQCLGDCGKTYSMDEIAEHICPECKGKLVLAPPILKIDRVRYIFPENAHKIFAEDGEENLYPGKFLAYYTNIALPRNLILSANRLSPYHFNTLVTIPSKASYSNPKKTNDDVSIITNWRILENDQVFVFCSIGFTKYNNRSDLPFIPQLTFNTINTKIVDGFKKGKTIDDILKSTIISDWILTKPINFEDIGNFNSLDDLPR